MESVFPKSTLVVAVCISTFSLLAHAAGLVAYCRMNNMEDRGPRIILHRQTLYFTFAFCSSLAALLLTEFSNASPKLPLAWSFLSVAFLEADRRQLLGPNEKTEKFLTFSPLFNYIRPLSLFYATAPNPYYPVFTFVPIIIEFSFTHYEKPSLQHKLHLYRCPLVALLMVAFLAASLVAGFRRFRQTGLILGLALDVLFFLTFPFQDIWSENTLMWWVKNCPWSLREDASGRILRSNNRSQSQEELQHNGSQDISIVSMTKGLDSVTAISDEFQMRCHDEEHSVRTVR